MENIPISGVISLVIKNKKPRKGKIICVLRQALSKEGHIHFCIRVAPLSKYSVSHFLLKKPLL